MSGTRTSSFGGGRRESHDASGFYRRFDPPVVISGGEVGDLGYYTDCCKFMVGPAQDRVRELPRGSVALVVTSPPYFAGKEYEQDIKDQNVPATYVKYLEMLRSVFAACLDALEPGGRMAVNVANLGRRPYRSLAGDVLSILQDDLRMLPLGELVWVKARGASGSCAWGSFCSPSAPVLRDVSERVLLVSKHRFGRVFTPRVRKMLGLPWVADITKEEFMRDTLDIWNIPPASAKRVGHPAPFPTELPRRLIKLYTYQNDVVLDPFAGSGTTGVACTELGRRAVLVDTSEEYMALSRKNVEKARAAKNGP